MFLLKTRFGEYLLNNANRIDFYTQEEDEDENESIWAVYLSVDSHKQVVCEFQEEKHARIFCKEIREIIMKSLMSNKYNENESMNMDYVCTAALQRVQGV